MMRIDVRIPIGLLFGIVGALLTVYGVATLGEPGSHPTGLPIDLIWGIVMLVFGIVMLALFRRAHAPAVPGEDPGEPGDQPPQH